MRRTSINSRDGPAGGRDDRTKQSRRASSRRRRYIGVFSTRPGRRVRDPANQRLQATARVPSPCLGCQAIDFRPLAVRALRGRGTLAWPFVVSFIVGRCPRPSSHGIRGGGGPSGSKRGIDEPSWLVSLGLLCARGQPSRSWVDAGNRARAPCAVRGADGVADGEMGRRMDYSALPPLVTLSFLPRERASKRAGCRVGVASVE